MERGRIRSDRELWARTIGQYDITSPTGSPLWTLAFFSPMIGLELPAYFPEVSAKQHELLHTLGAPLCGLERTGESDLAQGFRTFV